MPQIFLSYKRENDSQKGDEIHRDEVIKALENLPYDYWYDKEQIQGGELWRQSIEDALENSFVCLVVVTDKVIKSEWSFFEVSFALGFGITVIPWYVNGNPPPPNTTFGTLLNELNGIKNLSELNNELSKRQKNYVENFLNDEILQITLRTRVLAYLGCAFAVKGFRDDAYKWLDKFWDEYNTLDRKLRNLWLNHSSAFNRKQKRIYNQLIQEFKDLRTPASGLWKNIAPSGEKQIHAASECFFEYLTHLDNYMDSQLGVHVWYKQFRKRIDYLGHDFSNSTKSVMRIPELYGLNKDEMDELPFFHFLIPDIDFKKD